MSINIKNEETARLARDLANDTGESIAQAVTTALRERLDRISLSGQVVVLDRVKEMCRISKDALARWIEPFQSSDHCGLVYVRADCRVDS